jgi:glycosyltransferase involved in cell wall biosynthesis
MPTCSIIIRAYNEAAHLPRLLEGVARQTVQDAEIILVDSGSTDATAAIARGYGARVVGIPPGEFTFGRSLNRGIAAASGEVIVIASAHVYPVYPDWLEKLTAPLADPAVALTYGKQRGMATTKYSEHQVFARWFPDEPNPRQTHPFCNNANAAIRRAVWEQRPYDETLTGLEDLAWAKGALAQGLGISYVPEAEIIHVHDEAWRGVFNRYRREGMAFKRLYDEAHFNLYDCVRMIAANVLSDWRHAARARVLFANWRSILYFRTLQFWGTYRGYRDAHTPLTAPLRQRFYYPRGMDAGEAIVRGVKPIRYNDPND